MPLVRSFALGFAFSVVILGVLDRVRCNPAPKDRLIEKRVQVTDTEINVTSGDGRHKLSICGMDNGIGIWLSNGDKFVSIVSGIGSPECVYIGLQRNSGDGCEWGVAIDDDETRIQRIGGKGRDRPEFTVIKTEERPREAPLAGKPD